MAYKEHKITKLYYSMHEVAELFDVNQSLIRYWENEFEVLTPKKNKKGNRLFTPKDLDCLKLIYDLLKVQGYTMDGAKKYLSENGIVRKSDVTAKSSKTANIEKKLKEIKKRLIELKESL